jgi:hypothetical protein
MRLENKIRKAYDLLAERDRIDHQLSKMFGTSGNGFGAARKPSPRRQQHMRYVNAVGRLPKSKRAQLSKIYKEKGVQAAVAAAQAAVEEANR